MPIISVVDLEDAPLLIIKERLDNSVSAAEKASDPRVYVDITNNLVVVGNNGEPFPLENIQVIYDPHYRATSKVIPMFEKGFVGHYNKVEVGFQSLSGSYVMLIAGNKGYKISYHKIGNEIKLVIEECQAKMCSENNVTEFHLPLATGDPNSLVRYTVNYACCNPHVTFEINGKKYMRVCQKSPLLFSCVKWLEKGYQDFKNIVNLYGEDPSAKVEDLVSKLSPKGINVGEMAKKPLKDLSEEEILWLYNFLLQFDEPAIPLFKSEDYVERLKQIVNVEKYGYATSIKRDKKGNFAYALEVLAAKVSNTECFYSLQDGRSKPVVICCINSSPLLTNIWYGGKKTYFPYGSKDEDLFKYINKKSGGKCDFLLVNLLVPKPPWTSYSKSDLHVGPYLNTFKMLLRKALLELKGGRKHSIARELLEQEIRRRISLRELYGQIPPMEWIPQNGLWYKVRRLLGGEDKMDIERKNFLDAVEDICKKYGFSRDELGITCAPRGEFYYRGEVHPLTFESIEKLAQIGTDIVHIEKEGPPRTLKDVAKDYPIAFTHCRGFIVEYSKRLMELSQKTGAHIVMITDLDDAGLAMKYQLPNIVRIGVDDEMVQYFGLREEDLREKYTPGSHLAFLESINKEEAEKVKKYRIEIDSILAEVGPARLLEYIIFKLTQLFPERNYNRAIDVSPVLPEEVNDLTKAIKEYLQNTTRSYLEEIRRRLETWHGLEKVDKLEEKIKKEILEKELSDDGVKLMLENIRKLIAEMKKMQQVQGGGVCHLGGDCPPPQNITHL